MTALGARLEQSAQIANVNNSQEYEKAVSDISTKRVALVNEGNGKINQAIELENQAKTAQQEATNRAEALEAEALALDAQSTTAE